MTVFIIAVIVLLGMLVLYMGFLRPRHLHWGATDEEVAMDLPGDDIVAHPNFDATRGITVHSTPDLIWRWLIQMGSGRAGFYSIDLIDNAGKKSASEILPQFQTIEEGQFIPFTPSQTHGMWVKSFIPHEYILWTDKRGHATWLWYLVPVSSSKTRLLSRLRTKYVWKGLWILYYLLYDVGDIMMMRRCMKGIKLRAGREYRRLTRGDLHGTQPSL